MKELEKRRLLREELHKHKKELAAKQARDKHCNDAVLQWEMLERNKAAKAIEESKRIAKQERWNKILEYRDELLKQIVRKLSFFCFYKI